MSGRGDLNRGYKHARRLHEEESGEPPPAEFWNERFLTTRDYLGRFVLAWLSAAVVTGLLHVHDPGLVPPVIAWIVMPVTFCTFSMPKTSNSKRGFSVNG